MYYKVILEPDIESGGYIAYCPTLGRSYSSRDFRRASKKFERSNRIMLRRNDFRG
jgi:hypothetical protein